MAKLGKFASLLMAVLMLATMAAHAADDGGAVIPEDTPAPAPAETPAPTNTEPPVLTPAPAAIDTSTDQGKFQQAQSYESAGKINQALIMYLQLTAASDAQIAGMAAYHAGGLFMNNKSDSAKAAKLFQFSFAVSHYQDAALQAGNAFRAMQNYAMACKMFRWGAVDSTDASTKTQCAAAFNETLPMFQANQGKPAGQ